MTFAFRIGAICKTDALLELDSRLDKSQMSQTERDLVSRHVRDVIVTLDDPSYDEMIAISCHGYSVTAPGSGRKLSATVSVSAYVMSRI